MRFDYADCAQSTGIYVETCLSMFLMAHGPRKTRVLSEIIKSWSKFDKMDEK